MNPGRKFIKQVAAFTGVFAYLQCIPAEKNRIRLVEVIDDACEEDK